MLSGVERGQKESNLRSPFIKRVDFEIGNISGGTGAFYRAGPVPIPCSSYDYKTYSASTTLGGSTGKIMLIGMGLSADVVSAGILTMGISAKGVYTHASDGYAGTDSTVSDTGLRPALTPTTLYAYTNVYNKIALNKEASGADNQLLGASDSANIGWIIFYFYRSESLSVTKLRAFAEFIPVKGEFANSRRLKEY